MEAVEFQGEESYLECLLCSWHCGLKNFRGESMGENMGAGGSSARAAALVPGLHTI